MQQMQKRVENEGKQSGNGDFDDIVPENPHNIHFGKVQFFQQD